MPPVGEPTIARRASQNSVSVQRASLARSASSGAVMTGRPQRASRNCISGTPSYGFQQRRHVHAFDELLLIRNRW